MLIKGSMLEIVKQTSQIVTTTENTLAQKLRKCILDINPVQDLHGYDHPWPGGNGENILDPNIRFATQTVRGVTLTTTDGYNFTVTGTGESGSESLQTNAIPTADCIVYPAGTYTVTGMIVSTYHTDGSWYGNRIGTFTSPEDFIIRSGYREISVGTTYNTSNFISMTKGSTALIEWTPYSNVCPITGWTGVQIIVSPTIDAADGQTYSIAFPSEAGTVYGGTLNITIGELVVDKAAIASYNGELLPGEWISDRDVYTPGNSPTLGAQVVYSLTTPIVYTLTPIEINISGVNNIWNNTNGNTTIIYFTRGTI